MSWGSILGPRVERGRQVARSFVEVEVVIQNGWLCVFIVPLDMNQGVTRRMIQQII